MRPSVTNASKPLQGRRMLVSCGARGLAEGFFEPHLGTVAAPVRDGSGRIVAAIGLTVPGERIPAELHATLTGQVVACAREFSSRLDGPAAEQPADAAPPPRRAHPARRGSTMPTSSATTWPAALAGPPVKKEAA